MKLTKKKKEFIYKVHYSDKMQGFEDLNSCHNNLKNNSIYSKYMVILKYA